MNRNCLPGLDGMFQLSPEDIPLDLSRGVVIMIVESNLTPANATRVGQGGEEVRF